MKIYFETFDPSTRGPKDDLGRTELENRLLTEFNIPCNEELLIINY